MQQDARRSSPKLTERLALLGSAVPLAEIKAAGSGSGSPEAARLRAGIGGVD
jgi:hypothetical protein